MRKLFSALVSMFMAAGLLVGFSVTQATSAAAASLPPWVYSGPGDALSASVKTVEPVTINGGQKLIVGGDFTGEGTNRVVLVNPDGSIDPTFDVTTPFNGSVNVAKPVTVGGTTKILVGGGFGLDGEAKPRLRMFNLDGSLDTVFNENLGTFSASIYDVAQVTIEGTPRILIGGQFSNYQGRARLAALNLDGTLYEGFDADLGTTGSVRSISAIQQEGELSIFAGGNFNMQDFKNIAAFDEEGNRRAGFNPGPYADGGQVETVSAFVDGDDLKVLVGGAFSNELGNSYLFLLNALGSADLEFNPGSLFNDTVRDAVAISTDSGYKYLVGGAFTSTNGEGNDFVIYLNSDGSPVDSFAPGDLINSNVEAVAPLTVDEELKFAVGGVFTSAGGNDKFVILNSEEFQPPGTPEPPTSTVDEVGKITATVNTDWAVEGGEADSYTMRLRLGDDVVDSCVVEVDDPPLECQFVGLDPTKAYSLTSQATNSDGVGEESAGQNVVPNLVPAMPAAPTPIEAVGTGKINVTVVPVDADATHGEATSYRVMYRVAGSGSFGFGCDVSANPTPINCDVTGLDPTESYEFRVYAQNNVGFSTGESPWSNPSVLANAAPGQVAKPEAEAVAPGQAGVTWFPPDSGGTPTGYTAQAYLNGVEVDDAFCTFTPGDPVVVPFGCTVTGLDLDESYTFAVTASNAIEPPSVSEQSEPVVANVAPNTPAKPTVELTGDGAVSVTVSPNEDGPVPTSYTVTALIGGSPVSNTCTITPPATACSLLGLSPSSTYTFVATATNLAGESDESEPSDPIIPGKPGTPGRPLAQVLGDNSVRVTAVAPAEGTGGVPTSYTVTPLPGDDVTPQSCTITLPEDALNKCVFSGLNPEQEYRFAVTANNEAGPSDPALSDGVVTAVPAQPQQPIVTLAGPGAGKVKVEVVPTENPGRVTRYLVKALDPHGNPIGGSCNITPVEGEWPDPLECEVDTIPVMAQTFQVTAFNDQVASEPSVPAGPIVPNVPAKPGTPVAVLAGLDDVDVTFTAGVSATHGAPASFEVTAVPGGQSCTVEPDGDGVWPSPLGCRVSGLNPSQENEFVVVAKNAAGDSDLSELSNKVTASAPDAPQAPTVVVDAPGDVTVTVVPATSGGTPSSYTIQAYIGDEPVEGKTCTVAATDSPLACPITGLDKDTEYTFTAVAHNVVDSSEESPHSQPAVFPNVKPAKPATPTAQVTGLGELEVEVEPNAGTGTDEYVLSVFEDGSLIDCPIDSCTIPATPTPLKWNLDDLDPTKSYMFEVTAKNSAGNSLDSNTSAPIVPAAPGKPTPPTAGVTDKGVVEITVAPSTTGGPAASYEVFALDGDGNRLSPVKSCTVQADAQPLACEITGLDPVTPVTFETVATNAAGSSVASDPSNAVTPNTPPHAPGKPTTKVTGDGEVTVTVPPATTGGQPMRYIVTAQDEDDPTIPAGVCLIDLPANPVECVIDGLDGTKPYTFSAVAENMMDGTTYRSDPSEASDPVIPGPPGAPGKPVVKTAGPGEVEVTVSPSTTGGIPVNYTVTSAPGGKKCTVSATANPLRCTVKGLTLGASYTFTAVATNGAGTSPASVSSNSVKSGAAVIVKPNKPAKERIKGKPNAKKFVVTWAKPKGTNAKRPVTGYRLTVNLRGKKKAIILKNLKRNQTRYTLTRKQLLRAVKKSRVLTRGEINRYVFTVRVQAKNSAGFSKASSSRLVMRS